MSEQHLAVETQVFVGKPADQLAARRRGVTLKVEGWLKRADAIMAGERFDIATALLLVQEIRNETGPGSIGFAAGQAIGYLQAANRLSGLTIAQWQRARALARNTTGAKERFKAVRDALALRASRS